MSALSPQWSARKVTTDYALSSNGSYIVYRPNKHSDAMLKLNNNNDDFTNVFVEEDEISVKIGSTVMMVGYIDRLESVRNPNGGKEINLHLTDWGSYLAGKTIFERDYKIPKKASEILSDASSEIIGMSTNISALNTTDEELKRLFNGTYVRDGFYSAVEAGGGEYFIDETKTLQAFPHDTRDLEQSPSNRYRIRDVAPALARDLQVDFNYQYKWVNDVTNRYRSTVVTNGIFETFPATGHALQELWFKDDDDGKRYSHFYRTLNTYSIDDTEIEPTEYNPEEDIGDGLVIPTIKLITADSGQNISVLVRPYSIDEDGIKLNKNFALNPLQWQRIGFAFKNGLTGNTVTSITMNLVDSGGNMWSRSILADMSAVTATGWNYVHYWLPPNLTTSPVYEWTKTGSPTTINWISFDISPTTGYDVKSYTAFGWMHFERRRRSSITNAGTPPTEKIVVDSRSLGKPALDKSVVKEAERANVVAKQGNFTINGNTDFRYPAYNIDVDFTDSLGTGRTGVVRLEEIRHILTEGVHKTTCYFNNSFNRP